VIRTSANSGEFKMAKLWGKNLNKEVEDFTVGTDFQLDQRLVRYDCVGSIAHAIMLQKQGYLSVGEKRKLVQTLDEIIFLDEKGKFKIRKQDEDCHTAIENYLVKKLGDTGKKIHFCRSRNDQVLTALRLYYNLELGNCKKQANSLLESIKNFKKKYSGIMMPGYTHTRKAMPSSIDLWAESFADSFKDDLKLLNFTFNLVNQSPLGTGAGYGLPTKTDRKFTAEKLGFKKVQENPIYAQNSRGKFESIILHSLSQIMLDLNKISNDIIFFSIPEIGYFKLPDELCTGSSIMPHKKNPDVLEIMRANYHIVNSYEFQVKNTSSNLISGYHRDLQTTKEPIMKGFDITKQSLSAMSLVFDRLEVNKENCKKAMTKELYSVKEVYKLSKKGTPFRDAYNQIKSKF